MRFHRLLAAAVPVLALLLPTAAQDPKKDGERPPDFPLKEVLEAKAKGGEAFAAKLKELDGKRFVFKGVVRMEGPKAVAMFHFLPPKTDGKADDLKGVSPIRLLMTAEGRTAIWPKARDMAAYKVTDGSAFEIVGVTNFSKEATKIAEDYVPPEELRPKKSGTGGFEKSTETFDRMQRQAAEADRLQQAMLEDAKKKGKIVTYKQYGIIELTEVELAKKK